MTPEEFGRHAGKQDAKKWKSQIWVILEGRKVRLWRTPLLKFYKEPSNEADGSSSSRGRQRCHRDEFLRCSRCNKERRFRLRTREDCRIYHDALAKRRWRCADKPNNEITCNDDEERASRKICRGCPRTPICDGCTSCVCFGCYNCRFSDCSCRTCVDYIRNVQH
ncbi:hypothetical protein L1049_000802 [Liquidambar formosana]|uniref:Uncharacterized protein n=1 Tax=Liquidambar formosana TaxID=63359 RepID=A0AAP0ND14_LIQFO